MSRANRGTIHLEQGRVLSQSAFDGEQFMTRLLAPRCARARAGSFVHVACDPAILMRRPLSIMRAHPQEGWIDVLYKLHGPGLRALSARRPGEELSVLGPIGRPFEPHPERPRTLLIGGGVGIPPMVFLAERLVAEPGRWKPLVLMGSEIPFPFKARPSRIVVAGMPPEAIACMPLLDEWGAASRLATRAGYPGCFDGFVTDLADAWLATLGRPELDQLEIFACGPNAMLRVVARLARRWQVACQVALEEYMACGVGGCAGCTVLVKTPQGPAMKRVCVDGPVFDAHAVYSD